MFLVNASQGDQRKSGVAFFNDLAGSHGKQPNAYGDVGAGNGWVDWEGRTHNGNSTHGLRLS
jgi:hypothetical protein